MTIYCATGNPGKLREFELAGRVFGVDVRALPGLNAIVAPEETGETFEENACLKAAYYSRLAAGPVFADDSGLAVDALGGAPGVYSARFAGPEAGTAENNQLLLERLTGVADRAARFVCVAAIAVDGVVEKMFRGEVEGEILLEARGTEGFGYDPLFFYGPFGCSFGEAGELQKLDVSHRGGALRAMMQYLAQNAERFA